MLDHLGIRAARRKAFAVCAVVAVSVIMLLLAACSSSGGWPGFSSNKPGEGTTVRMARATWDTGWFQAEVFKILLEELGYGIREPDEPVDNLAAYVFVSQGDIDFWANGWFPTHARFFKYGDIRQKVRPVGYQVQNGALQGYMIDKATAEELGIKNLGDLQDPEVAAVFDHDGDGKADMTGCNPGWGCEFIIEHHLDAYNLGDTITQVQDDYSALMVETVGRYESGQPVLFYTWTPNWTVSELAIGEDVVWLSVPFSSVPGEIDVNTAVDSVPGCQQTPCDLGFQVNDIRVAANVDFLAENPAAAKLFELVEIPLDDIAAQNVKMAAGENSPQDIRRHAQEWIEASQDNVDKWLEAARAAAQ